MKRFFAILLVAILLLSTIPATSMAAKYGTVVGGWLRLRSAPNFNAGTITSYYTGTVVEITGSTGGWYRVYTPDGRSGYMYGQYLKVGASSSGSSSGDAYVTSHNGYAVRLRKGPGTGYRVIASYEVGTPVDVLERGSYWSKVSIGGTTGYMMTQYLSFNGGYYDDDDDDDVVCYATIWSRNGYGVRLRKGPGKDYGTIGTYSVGTTVAVLKKGDIWDKIRVGSRVGYMMNEFLDYHKTNEVTSVTLNTYSPAVGTVLSVKAISPSKATVSYEWRVNGVTKGTASTYTVTSDDIGYKIQLKVTGKGSYTGSAKSDQTNKVLSNTQISEVSLSKIAPMVGDTLTVSFKPANANVLYAWIVKGTQVSNAATYKVKQADLGEAIKLIVTGTGSYSGSATVITAPVAESAALLGVSITNETNSTAGAAPMVGDKLTAVTSPSDASATYQWYRGSTAISGATSKSYVLTDADVDATIKVTAAPVAPYTGNTQTSAATAAVIESVEAPAITTAVLADASIDKAYSQKIDVTGTAPFTWSISKGKLPAGLTLSAYGVIAGTPEESGTFTFTVKASNASPDASAKEYTLVVKETPASHEITTNSLPDVVKNTAYTRTLQATGKAPIEWKISAGTIPQGVGLDENTGVFGGTPTEVGEFDITVSATDANQMVASKRFTFKVLAPSEDGKPIITTKSFKDAVIDEYYRQDPTATSSAAVTWSHTGELPKGLTLDPATGSITGTPTAEGKGQSFTFTLTATNDAGSASKEFTIFVVDPDVEAPEITTSYLPNVVAGESYSRQFEASGTEPFNWSCSSAPAGLAFDGATATISGTPTAAGEYTVTVTVKDGTGLSTSKSFTFEVLEASAKPVITTRSFKEAVNGTSYRQDFAATASTAVTWKVVNGSLPKGLTLGENTGSITGTPDAEPGVYSFVVTATDEDSNVSDPASYSITVVNPATTVNETSTDTSAAFSLERSGSDEDETDEDAGETQQPASNETPSTTEPATASETPAESGSDDSSENSSDVNQEPPAPEKKAPEITTNKFGNAKLGESYTRLLEATADSTVTWTLADGDLPTGLDLSEDGYITGTPHDIEPGTVFEFVVQAEADGETATKPFSITVIQ